MGVFLGVLNCSIVFAMKGTPNTQKKTGQEDVPSKKPEAAQKPAEIGGRGGLDPVRYGDWEIGGKCVDF